MNRTDVGIIKDCDHELYFYDNVEPFYSPFFYNKLHFYVFLFYYFKKEMKITQPPNKSIKSPCMNMCSR